MCSGKETQAMVPLKAPPTWPTDLLTTISSLNKNGYYNNVCVACSDGSLSAPGVLLASVWPVLRRLGAHVPDEDMLIILPDIDVSSMANFVRCLLCISEPCEDDLYLFTTLLAFFNRSKELPKHERTIETPGGEPSWEPKVKVEVDDWGQQSNCEFDSCQQQSMFKDEIASFFCDEDEKQKPGELRSKFKMAPPQPFKFSKEYDHMFDPNLQKYVCPTCHKAYGKTANLSKHVKWHMRNPGKDYNSRFACQDCHKVFLKGTKLKLHRMNKHTVRPRDFKCTWDDCKKAFMSDNDLKAHLRVHLGEKNFICETCGRSFQTKHILHAHNIRMHSNLKHSIPCEECGKLYKCKEDVISHQKIHRAQHMRIYKCDDCNLTFRSEESWRKHMIRHDPNRPYPCNYCTVRFNKKDQLKIHMAKHEGKIYRCMFCEDRIFYRYDNLKKHVKVVHPTENVEWKDFRTKSFKGNE